MQSTLLEAVPSGTAKLALGIKPEPTVRSDKLRLRPRLRRWLKKLKQYGRFDLDLDLQGLLHLTIAAALAATLLLPPPAGTAAAAPYAGTSAQVAASSLGVMLTPRLSY